jgi:hypothetical protein
LFTKPTQTTLLRCDIDESMIRFHSEQSEHKSTYDFADAIVKGVQIDKSVECKTASLIFNAITRFADSRVAIDETLSRMESTIKSEKARLRNGSHLDLGWININQEEEQADLKKQCKNQRSCGTKFTHCLI